MRASRQLGIALACAMGMGCGGEAPVVDAGETLDVGAETVDAAAEDAPATGTDAASVPSDAAPSGPLVQTRVGSPTWEVGEVAIFSAPVGTSSSLAPLEAELTRLFGPEHMTAGNGAVLVDGAPHGGPYETELGRRLAAGAVTPGHLFHVSDWTAPQGLVFVALLVPGAGAPTGSSSDAVSGPIIPASAYPLRSAGALFHDGALVDPAFDGSLGPPDGLDGRSHQFVIMVETTEFIPGSPGEYRMRMEMRDATGAGWDVLATFDVE